METIKQLTESLNTLAKLKRQAKEAAHQAAIKAVESRRNEREQSNRRG